MKRFNAIMALFMITISMNSIALEREGFSNNFRMWNNIELRDGQTIDDEQEIKAFLGGFYRVTNFQDPLCAIQLLKNSTVLAELAMGNKIVSLQIEASDVSTPPLIARGDFVVRNPFVPETTNAFYIWVHYEDEESVLGKSAQVCLVN